MGLLHWKKTELFTSERTIVLVTVWWLITKERLCNEFGSTFKKNPLSLMCVQYVFQRHSGELTVPLPLDHCPSHVQQGCLQIPSALCHRFCGLQCDLYVAVFLEYAVSVACMVACVR